MRLRLFGLLAFIVLASPVHAGTFGIRAALPQAQTCGSLLSEDFSNDPKALDRISGRVSVSHDDSGYSAVFKSTSNASEKVKGGEGQLLISTLSNHIDLNSPTALRVEEKAVISTADIERFKKETQDSPALRASNKNTPVVWSQRDLPKAGHQFVTITEYGGQVTYHLNETAVSFIAKARYRKYYEFPISQSQDITQYRPVRDDIAFEIKMTSLAGPSTKAFLAEPETVFKPRIFLSNELADALKQVRGDDLDFVTKLNAIKLEVLKLNKRENPPEQVESLFSALVLILKVDPAFLSPTLAISYERDAYRFVSTKGEFQFTVDRNVRMFQANPNLPSANMQDYMLSPVTFQSQPTEAFAELKTPIKEKQSRDPLYVGLFDSMNLNHFAKYRKGSGKKSVAKYLDQAIGDQNMDRTILDQGTEFWIKKSVGSLDTYPKKNDLLSKQEMMMAVPFTSAAGEQFKLVLKYQPVKRAGAGHEAVLSEIRMYDPNGAKVSVAPNFETFVREMTSRPSLRVVALDIDGTVVPFLVRLNEREVSQYNQFLLGFYQHETTMTGKVRDLNGFASIQNQGDMRWQMAKLKASNALKWIIDRSEKFAMTGVLTVALLTARDHFMYNPVQNTVVHPTTIEKVEASSTAPVIQVTGFNDLKGNPVQVLGYMDQNYNYFFYFSSETQKKIGSAKVVELVAANGDVVRLSVIGTKNGKTIYSMSK